MATLIVVGPPFSKATTKRSIKSVHTEVSQQCSALLEFLNFTIHDLIECKRRSNDADTELFSYVSCRPVVVGSLGSFCLTALRRLPRLVGSLSC